jgi:hypothetical protein
VPSYRAAPPRSVNWLGQVFLSPRTASTGRPSFFFIPTRSSTLLVLQRLIPLLKGSPQLLRQFFDPPNGIERLEKQTIL